VTVYLLGRRTFRLCGASAHRKLLLRVCELALQALALLDERDNARRDFVGRRFEAGRSLPQLCVAIAEPSTRGLSRKRFDAPDARRDGALANDLEQLNIAQRAHVVPPQSSTE